MNERYKEMRDSEKYSWMEPNGEVDSKIKLRWFAIACALGACFWGLMYWIVM